MLYQVRTRSTTADGGKGVDRKRLDGGRDRTGLLHFCIKDGFVSIKRRISYFSIK